ncbi:chloride channel protein [Komagataeibacter rhaeticus]|nr:chloride channel protein [Komagataeibacter rhaeticus]
MTGLVAVGYNRTTMAVLRLAGRLPISISVRPVLVGGLAGLVVCLAPHLAGGKVDHADGHKQRDRITSDSGTTGFSADFWGPVLCRCNTWRSVCPMLALGALSGLGSSVVAQAVSPDTPLATAPFVIVGMASMFAGSVRAPLTGIILVMEMTGSSELIMPLLSGSFAAMVVAGALETCPFMLP